MKDFRRALDEAGTPSLGESTDLASLSRLPSSEQPAPPVQWLALLAAILAHAGGFNRKSWRLIRDYWTVYRSGKFDRQFYFSSNSDVASAGMDPLFHYLAHGEAEGRSPSAVLSARRLAAMFDGRVRPRRNRLATLARTGDKSPPRLADQPTRMREASSDGGWQLPKVHLKPLEKRDKKIVVYTAIFDDYDKLIQPDVVSDAIDYICFSNRQSLKSGAWQIRSLDYFDSLPRRMARYAKLHPHRYFPEYEWSLWVDGRIAPRISPLNLVERQTGGELFAFHHPDRSSPYDEALEVIRLQLDQERTVGAQMQRYQDQGFPSDIPLHETGVLLRKHMSPAVIRHSRLWWSEIERGSIRDQLSFDYAAWRSGIEVSQLAPRQTNVRNDERFAISKHRTYARADATWKSALVKETVPPLSADSMAWHTVNQEPVDVIVCVHNALPDVMRCLQSIDDSRDGRERLIVVDDGSATETANWLTTNIGQRFRDDLLIRRDNAGGYTVAANAGLRASSAPNVVMLNSDAIVPRSWLTKLRRAVHSGTEIGLAGPLSNAASYQSVPELTRDTGGFKVNDVPSGMTIEEMDALCEGIGRGLYPRVPSLNGFCMLIRRSVIDSVGLFDELSFPRGYGEENDYCFRAAEVGFSSVIACDAYVFHAKSRSYTTPRRNELARTAGIALKAKWSEERVRSGAQTLEEHPWLAAIRHQAAEALAGRSGQTGRVS